MCVTVCCACVKDEFKFSVSVCSIYVCASACLCIKAPFIYVLSRWEVVTSCWTARPKERPKSASLVNTLADLLDTDPTYIKLI